MKIAAGRWLIECFGAQAELAYPYLEWLAYTPPNHWSAPPTEIQAAVLVGDSYTSTFKKALLDAPSLRWIHTENSGIDDAYYRQILDRGIQLTTSPGANAPEVAEFVFGMILRALKRLDVFQIQKELHQWRRLEMESLSDKTILIVGLGAIGSRVATIAKSFGMEVLAIRRTGRIATSVDELGNPADLEQFLPRADIVVLALPYSPGTHNLISDKQFSRMKANALLINIARGGIVDAEALKRALSARPAMQVCLDVLVEEPLPADDDLWNYPNLFITPHVAWCSPLYRPRAAAIWIRNLARLKEGKPLLHLAVREAL